MDTLQALILALIQGLTEFLPISSSAHLVLPSVLFGWPDQGLAFDVAVHLGTLGAVLSYFRSEVKDIMLGWVASLSGSQLKSGALSPEARLGWQLILATLPAVLAGLLFSSLIEAQLRSVAVIAWATLLFGVALYFGDRFGSKRRSMDSLSWWDALWMGVAQSLALIPGASRSGVTMTMGLALGLARTDAARFSFLMSIPVIVAAGSLKTYDLIAQGVVIDWSALLLGIMVAYISAYLCIKFFLMLLERVGLLPFVIYRLVLAGLLFVFVV